MFHGMAVPPDWLLTNHSVVRAGCPARVADFAGSLSLSTVLLSAASSSDPGRAGTPMPVKDLDLHHQVPTKCDWRLFLP